MNVKYLDPYKDDPYGKLRGDKANAYFEIYFDEAKLHEVENGYILAAYVNQYQGITRNFKPENPLEQGLCAIPFYNDEYEIRQKINGNWEGVKHQPSLFEKAFCDYVKKNPDIFLPEGKGLIGKIAHVPNGMCANKDAEQLEELVKSSVQIESIPLVGLLKPYTPPQSFQRRSSGGGYSKGVSMDDKMSFVKKQLIAEVGDDSLNEDTTLGVLIDQMVKNYPMDTDFLVLYFDTLQAIIS